MINELESAKIILKEELKYASYVKENLYGNAASKNKIENYIIQSVLSNEDQGTCLDWIEKLLLDNNIHQKDIISIRNKAELQYAIMKRFKNKSEFY